MDFDPYFNLGPEYEEDEIDTDSNDNLRLKTQTLTNKLLQFTFVTSIWQSLLNIYRSFQYAPSVILLVLYSSVCSLYLINNCKLKHQRCR